MTWALQTPELSDTEFSNWQLLLEEKTGISFEKHKLILQTGLNQRMREVGCTNYETYFKRVSGGKSGAIEWESLLRTLTIKETRFFRDPAAFGCVRGYLFDRLSGAGNKAIDIWSVACSTGEEAYSLAMLANDCIEGFGGGHLLGVTATDICIASLKTARKGLYRHKKVEVIDPLLRSRYFDATDDLWQINQNIQSRICFVQANIIDLSHLPLAQMDVIFCQNVLVYFKQWRQHQVLDSLAEKLKPGGILVVGSGESVGWQNTQVKRFQDENVNAYMKKNQ